MWATVHPSNRDPGGWGDDLSKALPWRIAPRLWESLSEDDQCVEELRFGRAVLEWWISRHPGRVSFEVGMPDTEERNALLAAARLVGVDVAIEPNNVIAGPLVSELTETVVTCTQSVLEVSVGGEIRCVVVDHLDDLRVLVDRQELKALGVFLAHRLDS